MQTFLPYPSYQDSARSLDDLRLRNQIREVQQIARAFSGGGWAHHPVTVAWRDYPAALQGYLAAILAEYRRRGGTRFTGVLPNDTGVDTPYWVGSDAFHRGHRGHLHRKDPVRYEIFAPDAQAPLFYPYQGVLIERVAPGQFQGRTVQKSVKAAWASLNLPPRSP